MKIRLFHIALLFLFVMTSAQAQQPRSKEERIKAVKIAFITEELELTAKQSQGFWPLYNELQDKLKALRKENKGKPDIDNMSDQELEAWLDNHLRVEEEKIATHRAYIQKFKTVISIRQIAKLSQAERRFKHELLKRAKERREAGGRRGGGAHGGRGDF